MPVLLLFLAALAAGFVAYGSHPVWAQYPHGLEMILLARQLQWPLVAVSIIFCLALVALIVAGRRRAWWLIGLSPVLALFMHRFATDPLLQFSIVDNPPMVSAADATFIADGDWVLGLVFNEQSFAFPFSSLYRSPVVFVDSHDQRMLLIWSAYANRGVAHRINRELHARDLEIVSMPGNALLLYNRKLGQFIDGIAAQTAHRQTPSGFTRPIAITKCTWGGWRLAHPGSRVMVPVRRGDGTSPSVPLAPAFPLLPPKPSGAAQDRPSDWRRPIILIATTQPVALPADWLGEQPLNINIDALSLLIFHDPKTGRLRGFDRSIDGLIPRFSWNTDPRRPRAVLIDSDSNSGWSADGRAVDGPLTNKRLAAIDLEGHLIWGIVKPWMPQLQPVQLNHAASRQAK